MLKLAVVLLFFGAAEATFGGCCGMPPPPCPPPVCAPPPPPCAPPPLCPPPSCPPPPFCPPPPPPPPPPACPPPPPQMPCPQQYAQAPAVDCCGSCRSPCRYRNRFRTHASKTLTAILKNEPLDETCNSRKLKAIILENMTSDPTISKRAIQSAAEEKYGGRFNVICANSDFTYVAYSDKYCQATIDDIICYIFRPL